MKKVIVSLAAVAMAVAAMSCTTISPRMVTSNTVGSKTGQASGMLLFGVLPLTSADWSLSTACRSAGITKVATVDTKVNSILGIIVTNTTIVTGE